MRLSWDLKYILKVLGVVIPMIGFLGTAALWVDTRYMHRQISDTRFIDLQIRLIENRISIYQRMIDRQEPLTESERMDYDVSVEQLKDLLRERNKLLGIGQ